MKFLDVTLKPGRQSCVKMTCGGDTMPHVVGVPRTRKMSAAEEKSLRSQGLFTLTEPEEAAPTPSEALQELKARSHEEDALVDTSDEERSDEDRKSKKKGDR